MKRILSVLILLATALPAAALIQPLKINFQGKLLDPATNSPKNGTVNMSFSLYNVPSNGTALYTEPAAGYADVQVTNGVFSVQIGTTVALSRDLFLGASAYLGVTVQGDSEMTPRQQMTMAAYAFTANQLSDTGEVRLIADATYSTFTSAGNFTIPGGLVASSGSFTSGVTASSGTFTATGNTQYSLVTSSGIQMNAGVLKIDGGGVTNAYGITTGSITVGGGSTLLTYLENQACTMSIDGTTVPGAAKTYTYNICRYSRIGKTVILNWSVATTANNGTGNFVFNGLPVASLNVASFNQHCIIGWSGATFAVAGGLKGYIAPNTTAVTVVNNPLTNTAEAAIAIDATVSLRVHCSYLTN